MTATDHAQEIASLEPPLVWQVFCGMATVPRPSKQEARIREHVRRLAEQKGLGVREDEAGNLIIDVPATPGCESAPITVLQAHLDMVCEANRGTKIDFEKDPIRLLLDKDTTDGSPIVRADGTTLGADNGIGVAMAMAVAFSPDVRHGPLELLFTVDEEAGMSGAKGLTPKSFWGRRLLNLDSEEDDSIYIGCAGGCDTNLTWRLAPDPESVDAETLRVSVEGLRGGHSGCDVYENRGNAIKLLATTLIRADVGDLRIGSITGGSKRNAIPREASAIVTGGAGTMDALRRVADEVCAEAKESSAEPNASIAVTEGSHTASWLSAADSQTIVLALAAIPNGVLGMSPSVPGLVQTSNNLSTIQTRDANGDGRIEVVVGTLSRSSSGVWLDVTLRQIAAVGRLSRASLSTGNSYPGWEPNPDSALLATARRVYEEQFGSSPKVAAIHAGLECGIIGERVGQMDMVSFGPRIEGAHSPDERVYVESVQKSWRMLVAVLDELANG